MGVEKFLAQHKQIGADTMVFIYHLEDHPVYAPLTQQIFELGGGEKLRGNLSDHAFGGFGEAQARG